MLSGRILKVCNSIFDLIVITVLLIIGTYACYALWDNNQVLASTEDLQKDLLTMKPQVSADDSTDNSEAFAELLAINSDVCAWLTLDNTNIDFPVLQGKDNLTYINKNVYGEFALAGSIYIDSRNNRDFTDKYNLIYGHHMANGQMFGDLDLYLEKEFFKENTTGTLILPNKIFNLEIIACVETTASDDVFFSPEATRDNIDGLFKHIVTKATNINETVLQEAKSSTSIQVVALSTCSSSTETNGRTIVLALMKPYDTTS